MRSFKKMFKGTFWIGLVSLVALWLVYKMAEILYGFLEPLRNVLFLVVRKNKPVLVFVVAIFIIMIFGIAARFLSNRASSRIPLISWIIGFIKIIHELGDQANERNIKCVFVEIASGVYRPGYTTRKSATINGQEYIKVYVPNTPNLAGGQTYYILKEKVVDVPQEFNRSILKPLTFGGLVD
jgi:uncharacterized membrane protein